MDIEKILVWYIDINGDTRIQVVDKSTSQLISIFLHEFSQLPAVKTILEAYKISVIHEVHENTWTEGFWVSSKNVGEDEP